MVPCIEMQILAQIEVLNKIRKMHFKPEIYRTELTTNQIFKCCFVKKPFFYLLISILQWYR